MFDRCDKKIEAMLKRMFDERTSNMDKHSLSAMTNDKFEWDKWRSEIPWINFQSEWSVRVIPPFAAAVVRFIVRFNDIEISVYLDCYNALGLYYDDGKLVPYWEAYLMSSDEKYQEPERFAMHDTKGLLDYIKFEFDKKR